MRLLLVIGLLALALLPPASPPAAAAASECHFSLGFRTLHDLIPDVVGSCTSDERYDPITGDGLQQTTAWHGKGGLLVWRKADNWTAFTDGASTWINGPNGLQKRANSERFAWEKPSPRPFVTDAPCALLPEVKSGATSRAPDGSTVVAATVRNRCNQAVSFTVDAVEAASQDGGPLLDAPTAYVSNLAPGESTRITAKFPVDTGASWVSWSVHWAGSSKLCQGPSGNWPVCVSVEPWLKSALWDLMSVPEGEWLVKVAAEHGVSIDSGYLGPGIVAGYQTTDHTITVDRALVGSSSWVRATVLGHELQHAADDAGGRLKSGSAGCYQAEEAAARREAQVWWTLWRGQLPPTVDELHADLNFITSAAYADRTEFSVIVRSTYEPECGQ